MAVCANSSQAGEGGQPRPEGAPPCPFQNLVADDAALEAWSSIGPPQPEAIIEGAVLNEVASSTARMFQNQFDLILPPADPDLSKMAVQMRLKDVRAIEIFNAMNLYFETEGIPAHWTLTLNGSRPTAILGVEKNQAATPLAETEKTRYIVISVADILYASGLALNKPFAHNLEAAVAAALDDVRKPGRARVNTPGGPVVKVHAQAAILVFSGTWGETDIVRSALEALKRTALIRKDMAEEIEKRAK
jgi:hypothetical protein